MSDYPCAWLLYCIIICVDHCQQGKCLNVCSMLRLGNSFSLFSLSETRKKYQDFNSQWECAWPVPRDPRAVMQETNKQLQWSLPKKRKSDRHTSNNSKIKNYYNQQFRVTVGHSRKSVDRQPPLAAWHTMDTAVRCPNDHKQHSEDQSSLLRASCLCRRWKVVEVKGSGTRAFEITRRRCKVYICVGRMSLPL